MNNETINLLFTGNDYAFDGIVTSLLSIIKHTKERLNVYVLTMDLSNKNPKWKPLNSKHLNVFKSIVKQSNKDSDVCLLDVTKFYLELMDSNVNEKNLYTPFAMIRLLADKVDMPNKVLYFDTDIIAFNDIKELWDIDINDYYYGAALDHYGKVFINRKYFNSGVMLLNMQKIKEENVFEKCRQLIQTKKMKFPDQSALNIVGKGKTKYLPSKYNSQKWLKKDTVIRHFAKTIIWLPYFHTRNVKPWDKETMHKYNIHYCDDILDEYLKIKKNFEKNIEI